MQSIWQYIVLYLILVVLGVGIWAFVTHFGN